MNADGTAVPSFRVPRDAAPLLTKRWPTLVPRDASCTDGRTTDTPRDHDTIAAGAGSAKPQVNGGVGGARGGIRTPNLPITSQLHYVLLVVWWCCLGPLCTVVARCSCWPVTARGRRVPGRTDTPRTHVDDTEAGGGSKDFAKQWYKGGELAYLLAAPSRRSSRPPGRPVGRGNRIRAVSRDFVPSADAVPGLADGPRGRPRCWSCRALLTAPRTWRSWC
jgi:hypothetical protein